MDELQKKWANYTVKLNDELNIDMEQLRTLNLDRSRQALDGSMMHEIANVGFLGLFIIFLLIANYQLWGQLEFTVPGMMAILLSAAHLGLAYIKASKIRHIDYADKPVVALQKEVELLKLWVHQVRKLEFILLPVFVATIIPITFKFVQGIDVYQELGTYGLRIGFIWGFAHLVMVWINKNLYDNKIAEIKVFLAEIEEITT